MVNPGASVQDELVAACSVEAESAGSLVLAEQSVGFGGTGERFPRCPMGESVPICLEDKAEAIRSGSGLLEPWWVLSIRSADRGLEPSSVLSLC